MKNKALSPKQAVCILFLFLMGSTIVTAGVHKSAQDTWIPLLAAILLSIPLFMMFVHIMSLYPGKDLFEILEAAFGKRIGAVVSAVLILYCLVRGVFTIRSFAEITEITILDKTPTWAVTIPIVLVCLFMIKKGIHVFGKCSIVFGVIVVVTVTVTVSFSFGSMHLENLLPVGSHSISDMAADCARFLSYPFVEGFILISMFSRRETIRHHKRIFVYGLSFTGVLLFATVMRNILILGGPSFSALQFPSYTAVSVINVYDFLQRTEVLSSGIFLICVITKVTVYLYIITMFLDHLTGRKFAVSVSLIMALSASFFYAAGSVYDLSGNIALYILPIQILIPVAVWLRGLYVKKYTYKSIDN